MSDLDDKLERVLYDHRNDTPIGKQSALISDIKQAFADEFGIDQMLQDMVDLRANMQHNLVRLGLTATPTNHIADFSKGKLSKLMTGQEWYDRFEKEADKVKISQADANAPYHQTRIMQQLYKAAQRASGVSNEL